ncbi:MAG: hypothetical protein ABIT01_09515 [Thermoanaerobaculia bacterium]
MPTNGENTPDEAGDPAATGPKYDRYWDRSRSGVHQISRPIIVDGLKKAILKIELAPRIKWIDGEYVDDSYRAVEHATAQLVYSFSLEQLVMATVALRNHMRKSKEHIEKKKVMQELWTELARRMKKLKLRDEHLSFEEERLRDRRRELKAPTSLDTPLALEQVLELDEADLTDRRAVWAGDKEVARRQWLELEKRDEALLKDAPHFEQTDDLKNPYVLTLLSGGSGENKVRKRSLATAMNTFAEALQKPLSRTDQMLLEIALRRCIRASAPPHEMDRSEDWERGLLRAAENEFAAEFDWARAFVTPTLASDQYKPGAKA